MPRGDKSKYTDKQVRKGDHIAESYEARGVPEGVDCISPARHSEFSTPIGLLEFVVRLRTLSNGKPVGFKLCIGHPWEFLAICKAMLLSGTLFAIMRMVI